MSRKQKVSSHWYLIQCPFFHSDDFNSINCEGIIDGSSLRQIFRGKGDRIAWEDKYCKTIKQHELCPIYMLANTKYEGEQR